MATIPKLDLPTNSSGGDPGSSPGQFPQGDRRAHGDDILALPPEPDIDANMPVINPLDARNNVDQSRPLGPTPIADVRTDAADDDPGAQLDAIFAREREAERQASGVDVPSQMLPRQQLPGQSETARRLESEGVFERLGRQFTVDRERQTEQAAERSATEGLIDQMANRATDLQGWKEVAKGIGPGMVQFGGTMLEGGAVADPGQAMAANMQPYLADLKRVPEMSPGELALFRREVAQEPALATRSTVQSLISDLIDGGITVADIDRQYPGPTPVEERSLYRAGERVQQFGRELIPAAPGYEQAFGRQVGEGLGSLVAGLPFGLIGRVPAAVAFGSSGIGEATQRAIEFDRAEKAAGREGITQEQIITAGLLGVGPGLTDTLPIEVMLGRLKVPGMTQGAARTIAGAIGLVGGRVFFQTAIEGGQEAFQQFLQNVIAYTQYNPGQELTAEVIQNLAVGGAVGALAQGGKETVALLRRRGGRAPAPDARPSPEVAQPEPQPEASRAQPQPGVAPEPQQRPSETAPAPDASVDAGVDAGVEPADEFGLEAFAPPPLAPEGPEATGSREQMIGDRAEDLVTSDLSPVPSLPDDVMAVLREAAPEIAERYGAGERFQGIGDREDAPVTYPLEPETSLDDILPAPGTPEAAELARVVEEELPAIGADIYAYLDEQGVDVDVVPADEEMRRVASYVVSGLNVEEALERYAAETDQATTGRAETAGETEFGQAEPELGDVEPRFAAYNPKRLKKGRRQSQQASEPEPLTQAHRERFRKVLAGKAYKKDWARQAGVSDADLATLIEDAIRQGLLKRDARGVVRRTPQAKTLASKTPASTLGAPPLPADARRPTLADRETADADAGALRETAGGAPEEGLSAGVPGAGRVGQARAAPGRDRQASPRDVAGAGGADAQPSGPAGGLPGEGQGARGDTGERARDGDARADTGAAGLAGEFSPELQARIDAEAAAEEAKRTDRARANYRIGDADRLGKGGAKAKVKANIEAIRVLRHLEDEGRPATDAEKKALVKYVGWGAFAQDVFATHKQEWAKERNALADLLTPDEMKAARASTLNAHFTSPDVIKGMWAALGHLGFKGGRVIEPAAGIGHFIGLMPEEMAANSEWTAVELDPVSGGITKALYGAADVRVAGFETQAWPHGFFDLAISNVPFGDYKLHDPAYKPMNIHDYFFVKALDLVRPGGIVAFITSTGTLDKASGIVRREIARRGTFLGAVRLPGGKRGAFAANAGTEVTTDIVLLRRRVPGEPVQEDASWQTLADIKTPDGPTQVNGYFAENPEMMLGKMRLVGTMYREKSPVLIGPAENIDLKIIEAARNIPADSYLPSSAAGPLQDWQYDTPDTGIKEGAFYGKDGKLYRKVTGVGKPVELSVADRKKLPHFIAIRDNINALLAKQAAGDREGIEELRADLNAAYDEFVERFGPINKAVVSKSKRKDGREIITRRSPNFSPFSDDPDAYKVAALEHYDVETGTAKKAAIFTEDVVGTYVRPEITGPADALAVSLNERGRVDIELIAARLGMTEREAIAALGEAVYLDPRGRQWRTASQYLSGDVVARLDDARAAAEADPAFARNVAALEAVQPEPLTRVDIQVPFGAPWVPAEVYSQFIEEVIGARNVRIGLNEVTKKWQILEAYYWPQSAEAQFGTLDKPVKTIIEAALNSSQITVYREGADGERIRLPAAEAEAQAKVAALKEAFSGNPETGVEGWVWKDEERAQRLEALYNRAFNRLVDERHDGSHLTFPGLARIVSFPDGTTGTINLTPHRVNAIWRIIQNGNTLLDHVVGSGKAQPLDAKLLTPRGWTRMGDINVGDMVISVDGQPTRVIGVFPQGEKDIYRVTFSDGASTECCDEHLWFTQTYRERGYAQKGRKLGKLWACGSGQVRPLSEIRHSLVSDHLGAKNHSIPMAKAVHFNARPVPLDPYLVGVLIGDGCFRHARGVSLSTADDEIIERVTAALPPDCELRHRGAYDYDICYTGIALHAPRAEQNGGFRGIAYTRVNSHPVMAALHALGMHGKYSYEKRVPEVYLYNATEVRLAMLRGLMDTDGTVGKKGTHTSFCTSSPGLAADVVELVQSLGGIATCSTKRIAAARDATIVAVKMPPEINPFALRRKADLVRPKSKYRPARYIVSVDRVGRKAAQCIAIEHPSHLYVTDDFIVTHNTWTMIMSGMEQKRLGLIQRPMYVVPNHMLEQFSTEFLQAYPGAKLLVASRESMSLKRRREFAARIAAEKWDGIIITHDAFGRLRMSDAAYKDFYGGQLEEMEEAKRRAVEDAGKGAPSVKEIEKAKRRIEARLKKLTNVERKDAGVTFEELGVDFLYTDESHLFKNLAFQTQHTRVKGIANAAESQRATDLFIKIRHLERSRPGRAAVFATGTPVSNTMAELYTMQRYLQLDALHEYGIGEFDAWAKTFGDIVSQTELAPDGRTFRDTSAFSRFVNIPELVAIYSRIADTQTADMLKLPRPELKGGKPIVVEAEPSEAEEAYMAYLIQRAERLRREKVDPSEDNMLKIVSEGRKVATDMRLIDPEADLNPNGKIALAVKNIVSIWKRGKEPALGQMVFLDMGVPGSKPRLKPAQRADAAPEEAIESIRRQLAAEAAADEEVATEEADVEASEITAGLFDLYDDLRSRLVDAGIPKAQIAFIHEARGDDGKARLFQAVRDGKVRVLIGSTSKMGVGTNVQKRLVAMHHIDAPWKPAEVEQRDGRILRQGNLNPEIEIYRYVTRRSFDAYMWQTLERKARFIAQLKSGARGVRTAEDIDNPLPEAAELKAAAAGDSRIMEHAELSKTIRDLETARRAHLRTEQSARASLGGVRASLTRTAELLALYESDAALVTDLKGDQFAVTLELRAGRAAKVSDRKKAGEAVRAALLELGARSWYSTAQDIDLGEISGYRMAATVRRTEQGIEVQPVIEASATYNALAPFLITEQSDPVAIMRRYERLVGDVPGLAQAARTALARLDAEAPKLEAQARGSPFPRQAQLEEAKARLAELTQQLRPKEPQPAQPNQWTQGELALALRTFHGTPEDADPLPGPEDWQGIDTVSTPDGSMSLPVRSEIVELDDLKVLTKKSALQPRDRTSKASKRQVKERARALEVGRLLPRTESGGGAPIVLPDGTVLSGNGRVLAIKTAYETEDLRDSTDTYRAVIRAPEGMRRPVLIQRVTRDDIPRKELSRFAELSNARNPSLLGLPPGIRSTEQLPGYGTPEYEASRLFETAGGTLVGYDAAISYLRKVAEGAAGLAGVKAERQAIAVLGPPGAGKSTINGALAKRIGAAIVDTDAPKYIMPEMAELGSAGVHEESSKLSDRVNKELTADGVNIVREKVGHRPQSILSYVGRLKALGYTVRIVVVSAPRDVLLARIKEREERDGRGVPMDYFEETLVGLPKTLAALRKSGLIDAITEIDNSDERLHITSGKEAFDEDLEQALQQEKDAALRQLRLVQGGRGAGGRGLRGAGPGAAAAQGGRQAEGRSQARDQVEPAPSGGLGVSAPEVGKPFLVYRLGSQGGLDNRTAGSPDAVALHLLRQEDLESPQGGPVGDQITAYEVTISEPVGRYQPFVRALGGRGDRTVGYMRQHGASVYSFPAGGAWTAKPVGTIPLEAVRQRLAQMGYRDFDDAGAVAGAQAIEETFDTFIDTSSDLALALRTFHGTPNEWQPERKIRLASGEEQYILASEPVPKGAKVVREFPAGRPRLDKIRPAAIQTFGPGFYSSEGEEEARRYRPRPVPKLANVTLDGVPAGDANHQFTARWLREGGAEDLPRYASLDQLERMTILSSNSLAALSDEQLRERADRGQGPVYAVALGLRELRRLTAEGRLKWEPAQAGEMHQPPGAVYTLKLDVEPDELLDWDKPLHQQPPKVKAALVKAYGKDIVQGGASSFFARLLGARSVPETSVEQLVLSTEPEKLRTELLSVGIPGISFFEPDPGKGKGPRNYVMFDTERIEVTHKNGKPVEEMLRERIVKEAIADDAAAFDPAQEGSANLMFALATRREPISRDLERTRIEIIAFQELTGRTFTLTDAELEEVARARLAGEGLDVALDRIARRTYAQEGLTKEDDDAVDAEAPAAGVAGEGPGPQGQAGEPGPAGERGSDQRGDRRLPDGVRELLIARGYDPAVIDSLTGRRQRAAAGITEDLRFRFRHLLAAGVTRRLWPGMLGADPVLTEALTEEAVANGWLRRDTKGNVRPTRIARTARLDTPLQRLLFRRAAIIASESGRAAAEVALINAELESLVVTPIKDVRPIVERRQFLFGMIEDYSIRAAPVPPLRDEARGRQLRIRRDQIEATARDGWRQLAEIDHAIENLWPELTREELLGEHQRLMAQYGPSIARHQVLVRQANEAYGPSEWGKRPYRDDARLEALRPHIELTRKVASEGVERLGRLAREVYELETPVAIGVPAEIIIDPKIAYRESQTGRQIAPEVRQLALRLESGRGDPVRFLPAFAGVLGNRKLSRDDTQDLAALVGSEVPESTSRERALLTIRARHDAVIAVKEAQRRLGIAMPVESVGPEDAYRIAAPVTPEFDRAWPDVVETLKRNLALWLPADFATEVADRLSAAGRDDVLGIADVRERLVRISLAAGPTRAMATARHETIHILRKLGLFTDKEWRLLVAHARKVGVARTLKVKDAQGKTIDAIPYYRELYRNRFRQQALAQQAAGVLLDGAVSEGAINAQAEEMVDQELVAAVAEQWVGGARYPTRIEDLIARIFRFLEALRNALQGNGFQTDEDVFERTFTGEVAARERVEPRFAGAPPGFPVLKADAAFAITAYHGSPHDFERFDSTRIGTGEGAQAYGHGLYFAEREGTARWYRDTLEQRMGRAGWIPSGIVEQLFQRNSGAADETAIRTAARREIEQQIDERIRRLPVAERIRENLVPTPSTSGGGLLGSTTPPARGSIQYEIKQLRRALELVDAHPIKSAWGGRMYQVRLNAEPEDFLDWDKPLAEQSQAMRTRLRQAGIQEPALSRVEADAKLREAYERWKATPNEQTDRAYRDALSAINRVPFDERVHQSVVRNPEIVRALREAGIPGIRYLDQGSRGKGEGTYNYVVFDDSIIEITHKDGKPVTAQERAQVISGMTPQPDLSADAALALDTFHDAEQPKKRRLSVFGGSARMSRSQVERAIRALEAAIAEQRPVNIWQAGAGDAHFATFNWERALATGDMRLMYQAMLRHEEAALRDLKSLREVLSKFDAEALEAGNRFKRSKVYQFGSYAVRVADKAVDDARYISLFVHRMPEGKAAEDITQPSKQLGPAIGVIDLARAPDGRWDVGIIQVQKKHRKSRAAYALIKAAEAHIGESLMPSGILLKDGYDLMRKRFPEVERWWKPDPTLSDTWISPKEAIRRRNEAARRLDTASDDFWRSWYSEELGEYERLIAALPDEAKSVDSLQAMLALPTYIAPGTPGTSPPGQAAAPAGAPQGEVMGLAEIIEDLKTALGLTTTQGRYGLTVTDRSRNRRWRFRPQAEVRGQYDAQAGVARIRTSTDIEAIAHEGGHHLERVFGADLEAFKGQHAEMLGTAPAPDNPLPTLAPEGYSGLDLDDDTQATLVTAARALTEWRALAADRRARTRNPQAYHEVSARAATATRTLEHRLGSTIARALIADLIGDANRPGGGVLSRTPWRMMGDPLHPALYGQHIDPAHLADYVAERYTDTSVSATGTPRAHVAPTPAAGDLSEGFAEFFRRYITDPQGVRRDLPGVTTAFEDFLDANDPAMLEGIERLHLITSSAEYQDYLRATAKDRLQADTASDADHRITTRLRRWWKSITGGDSISGLPSGIRDGTKAFASVVYESGVDEGHPHYLIVKKLLEQADVNRVTDAEGRAISLAVHENPYKLMRSVGDAFKTGLRWVQDGMPSYRHAGVGFQVLDGQGQLLGLRRTAGEAQQRGDALGVPYSVVPLAPQRSRSLHESLSMVMGNDWSFPKYEEFGTYLIARRAVEEWARYDAGELPRPPLKAYATGQAADEIATHQAIIAQFDRDNQNFSPAAEIVYEFLWAAAVHDWQAGRLTDAELDYRATRRHFYVPYARDMSDMLATRGFGGRTLKFAKDKRFGGSDRGIMNPIETIIDQSFHRAAATHFNDVIKAYAELSDRAGPGGPVPGGAILERVTKEKEVAASASAFRQLEADLMGLGYDEQDAREMVKRIESDFGDTQLLLQWAPQSTGPVRPLLVPLWERGERRFVRINDPEWAASVYNSLNGIGRELSNLFLDNVALPATALRVGITTNPGFLLPNIFRDMCSAWILTGSITDPSTWPVITQARGLYHELSQTEMARLYQEVAGLMGGQNVAALSKVRDKADIMKLKHAGLQIRPVQLTAAAAAGGAVGFALGGPLGAGLGVLTGAGLHRGVLSFKETISYFADMSETATRLGVFTQAYRAALEYNPTLTPYQAAQEAAFVARDLIDFGRRGSRMLAAARLVPFLNANVQGLDKAVRQLLARSDRGNAVSTTKLIGLMAAGAATGAVAGPVVGAAAALAAPAIATNVAARSAAVRALLAPFFKKDMGLPVSRDEQRAMGESAKAWANLWIYTLTLLAIGALYRDDDEYKKNASLRVRNQPVKIMDEWFAFPKAFEWAVPSNIIEAAIEAQHDNDPRFWERVTDGLYEVLSPPGVPQTVKLWGDIRSNYNSWSERPIVPEYQRTLPPEDQYNAYSSELAIALARAVNKQPIARGIAETVGSTIFITDFELTPAIIDYALRTSLGYWGQDIQRASNLSARGASRIIDYPLIGTAVQRFTFDPNRRSDTLDAYRDLIGRTNASYARAERGYKAKVENLGAESGNEYLASLADPEQRAYAILQYSGTDTQKRAHPLNRLGRIVDTTFDMERELIQGRLADTSSRRDPQPIVLAPAKRDEILGIMALIRDLEANNAMVLLRHRQFAGRKQQNMEPALALLEASSPQVAEELRRRYSRKRVVDFSAAERWPQLRDTLLEDWQEAVDRDAEARLNRRGRRGPVRLPIGASREAGEGAAAQ